MLPDPAAGKESSSCAHAVERMRFAGAMSSIDEAQTFVSVAVALFTECLRRPSACGLHP